MRRTAAIAGCALLAALPAPALAPPAFDVLIREAPSTTARAGLRAAPTSACAATASRRSATSPGPRGAP